LPCFIQIPIIESLDSIQCRLFGLINDFFFFFIPAAVIITEEK